MRKLLSILVLLCGCAGGAMAQKVCFWADEDTALPVRVYVDRQCVGEITQTYDCAPEFGAPGTVSVELADLGKHEIAAVNAGGYEYSGWPGHIRPCEGENFVKIRGGCFRRYCTAAYILYDPLFHYGPRPGRHGYHVPGHRSRHESLSDEAEVEFIILAATAVIDMAVASAVNWTFPDNRFPYAAIGFKSEIFPSIGSWRNVARFKGRIGGLGGMSFLADLGYSINDWRSAPTYSVGMGWAYGGFEADLRYKPALLSPETFVALDLSYDWFVGAHLGISFNAGFALSGYEQLGQGSDGGGFDFPFGLGILYKF